VHQSGTIQERNVLFFTVESTASTTTKYSFSFVCNLLAPWKSFMLKKVFSWSFWSFQFYDICDLWLNDCPIVFDALLFTRNLSGVIPLCCKGRCYEGRGATHLQRTPEPRTQNTSETRNKITNHTIAPTKTDLHHCVRRSVELHMEKRFVRRRIKDTSGLSPARWRHILQSAAVSTVLSTEVHLGIIAIQSKTELIS
jgi:hypothetical protein